MEYTMRTNIRRTGTAAAAASLAAVLIQAGAAAGGNGWECALQKGLTEYSAEIYMPVLTYAEKTQEADPGEWIRESARGWIPLVRYVEDHIPREGVLEDEETAARILEAQADGGSEADTGSMPEQTETDAAPVTSGGTPAPAVDTSVEKLRDFEYLLSHFYTVDSSTMIGADQLNADDLLGRNMKIDTSADGPKVLVFHTHSQETFADSVPGDPADSIVGVGDYLTGLLNEKGIETLHDTGVYDIVDGKLDRSNAYSYAGEAVEKILADNPTIEVIIDLHRDGVAEGTRLVTEVNGKPTARIMFFNGLSRSRTNGDIGYLANPYIQDNLAFSLQMQLAGERMYPGFTRHIYLKAYRYNMHLMPKSLLVEAGAQTNTVEEMMNAMEPLAEMLYDVLISS